MATSQRVPGTQTHWDPVDINQLAGAVVELQGVANGGSIADHELAAEGHDPIYPSIYSGVTYRRGVLYLRFDDSPFTDNTVVQPLLDARYLPAGFAVIKGRLDTTTGGVLGLTTAQVLAAQAAGHEIMCHSRNHTDPTVQGDPWGFFVDETETVVAEMRAAGMNVQAWVQPGVWLGAWNFDSTTKVAGRISELFRKNYGAYEAYIPEDGTVASTLPLPARHRFGSYSPVGITSTVGTGISSLATCKSLVDSVVQFGGRMGFLFHSYFLGAAGELTVADFTLLLDYIQAARDAGELDVLTPTGTHYAQQAVNPPNLLNDPGFESCTPGAFPTLPSSASPAWYAPNGGATAVNGIGRDSGIAARCGQGSQVIQRLLAKTTRTVRLDGWMRNDATAGTITARLLVEGMQNNNNTAIVTKTVTAVVGQTYTALTALVGAHADVDYWRVTGDVSGAGAARLDDTSLVKL